MRILRVHNRYRQPGGEDVSFASEVELLREKGHDVDTLEVTNDTITLDRSPLSMARLAASTVWSRSGRTLVSDAVAAHRPQVVHFDNTFPLLSPAAYGVARRSGVAVVQTLHNYRLICPGATLFRAGSPCQDCVGRPVALPGVVHGCYRDSVAETATVAAMLASHRVRRTWSRDVDRYIALTDFARALFVAGGLPADRIRVKPNFARAAPPPAGASERRDVFLFAGRLSPEKGIETLLDAATELPAGYELHVAGDGPLSARLAHARLAGLPVVALGRLEHGAVIDAMRHARALVFPSVWYEGCPMTLLEAFACGLPVIASRLGAMAELISHGENGLLFAPGDAADLRDTLRWAADNPAAISAMSRCARRTYECLYSPERNYGLLMGIYDEAVLRRHGPQSPAWTNRGGAGIGR
jgi:glycosyltransferase involved in cell wall biosynthesis